jgi:UDP-3-O-acyl-N-acetylglucosamine deacetylase
LQHVGNALCARPALCGAQEVFQLRSRGLIRGGTIDCAIIGYGHDWYELEPVRFYEDEPARHLVVDLTVRLIRLAEAVPARWWRANQLCFRGSRRLQP